MGLSDLLRQADAVRYAAEDSSREAMADLLDQVEVWVGTASVPRRSWSGHERSVNPPLWCLVGATLGLGHWRWCRFDSACGEAGGGAELALATSAAFRELGRGFGCAAGFMFWGAWR